MRSLAALAAALVLAGCADHVDALKALAPVADDFDSSLAAEYLAYAESEAELGHMDAANYFAGKGLSAAKHEPVLPDTPQDAQTALKETRSGLLKLLTADAKRVNPQAAARAQLLYDCWLAQQRAGATEELATCADEFYSALGVLEEIAGSFIYAGEEKHTIKFASGSAALSSRTYAVIKEIAHRMKSIASYTIDLSIGSADSLAEQRVEAVRQAFIKQGVHAEKIKASASHNGKAVLLSNDVEELNTMDVVIRSYTEPKP